MTDLCEHLLRHRQSTDVAEGETDVPEVSGSIPLTFSSQAIVCAHFSIPILIGIAAAAIVVGFVIDPGCIASKVRKFPAEEQVKDLMEMGQNWSL